MYQKLSQPSRSRRCIRQFLGLETRNPGDGAFSEMENLTSDHYPNLAPRAPRGVHREGVGQGGLIAKDALCYVEGSALVVGEYPVELGLTPGSKRLVSMGAYVIVLPDKKYVNTANFSDKGSIDLTKTVSQVAVQPCSVSGEVYAYTAAPEAPEDTSLLWMESGEGKLYRWSASGQQWTALEPYLRLSAPGIGTGLAAYDGVEISGLGNHVLWEAQEDYLVISGTGGERTLELTISRTMPELDFVTELGNRLWGCRYGVVGGVPVNEICVSKLGDFKNWSCYMGIESDSVRISCGTDGPFTAAGVVGGCPVFFKEGWLHTVYGDSQPFGVRTIACAGVARGCGDSLAVVDGILYYRGRDTVMAFDGSLPVPVGQPLGKLPEGSAVGAALGSKYYLSQGSLFVLDTEKKLWHRESAVDAAALCACRGVLYCLTAGGDILTLAGGAGEETVRWSATTGDLGLELPDAKYITRLLLRLRSGGGTVTVSVSYDRGPWETLFTLEPTGLGSFLLPIAPRRCDQLRLRLEGEGDVRLLSLTRVTEEGSDRV